MSAGAMLLKEQEDRAFEERVESYVAGGVRELGGEIEAIRADYANHVASNTWIPQTHEAIARNLDAVESAARRLDAPKVAEDARCVAKGVREMIAKVTRLGNDLL